MSLGYVYKSGNTAQRHSLKNLFIYVYVNIYISRGLKSNAKINICMVLSYKNSVKSGTKSKTICIQGPWIPVWVSVKGVE